MKKTLLAAALIAGYAGAASAQNSVTLYGVVDVGLAYQSVKAPSSNLVTAAAWTPGQTKGNFGMATGVQSGSRWGLKGVEDLGDGLSANFVYEAGINNATGTSATDSVGFNRQSTLGIVSKSWGAVDLGRRTSSGTYALSGVDPFAQGFGTASLDSSFGTSFIRYSNMVMYTSPTFSGFSASVGYSFDTGATAAGAPTNNGLRIVNAPINGGAASYGTMNKTRAISVGLRYANGPVLLGAAYDQINPSSWNSGSVGATSSPTAAKAWLLGGTYDLKVVKIHAAYGQQIDGIIEGLRTFNSVGTGGDTNSTGGVLFVPGARTQSWMVGLSAPIGSASSVFGSVQQMIPGGEFDAAGIATQTVASIGYTYSLSKRTNLYAMYSYVNDVSMISGSNSNTLAVGVRHLF